MKPCVIWFTGLSGAGKSTIANEFYRQYQKSYGKNILLLDGDEIREKVGTAGFDYTTRKSHNKYVAFTASLFEREGYVVLVSLVSPYIEVRNECRKICANFIEVFVDTSLEECEKRDVKGLYKKARKGEIKDFTGIDSPYEAPLTPEIILKTDSSPEESVELLFKYCNSLVV